MGAKLATLYLASIIASSLFAADQVAPVTLSDEIAKSAIISQQVVIRSLKRNRLPSKQLTPKPTNVLKRRQCQTKTGPIANLRSTYPVAALPSKNYRDDF
jgi:hypothetical protein